jgi:hypothetical protein
MVEEIVDIKSLNHGFATIGWGALDYKLALNFDKLMKY